MNSFNCKDAYPVLSVEGVGSYTTGKGWAMMRIHRRELDYLKPNVVNVAEVTFIVTDKCPHIPCYDADNKVMAFHSEMLAVHYLRLWKVKQDTAFVNPNVKTQPTVSSLCHAAA